MAVISGRLRGDEVAEEAEDEVGAIRQALRDRRHEHRGLVIKSANGRYPTGRRDWIKVKTARRGR